MQKGKRFLNQLVDSLEDQGCRVRSGGKARYVVFPPSGGVFTIHSSPSDRRAVKNMRATVEQHGLVWPFDGNSVF